MIELNLLKSWIIFREMKTYEVLVSEELAHKYKIKAESEEQAKDFAMEQCDEGIEANLLESTRDRFEVINCEEY